MLLNAGPQLRSDVFLNIIGQFAPHFYTTYKDGLFQLAFTCRAPDLEMRGPEPPSLVIHVTRESCV